MALAALLFAQVLLSMDASRADADTPTPTNPTSPAPPARDTVTVRVESAKPATLYHRAKGEETFTKICESPCEIPVPLGDDYQLAVQGSNTANVAISGQPGAHVAVVVEPATGSKVVGAVLTAAGVGTFGVGAIIDLLAVSLLTTQKTPTPNHSGCSDCAPTGGVLLGVGLLVTAGGVVLGVSGISRLSSAKEGGITQHVIATREDSGGALSDMRAAAERPAPTWRTADMLVPAMYSVPVLSTTF